MNRRAVVAAWSRQSPACQLARRRSSSSTRRCTSSASGVRRAAPSISCAQRGLRVADDADFDRIDLADLLRIDVDLNQPRRRNRERVLGIPRAAVGLAERRADGEDDVGAARRVVGDARAPDAASCRSASGWSSGNAPLPISVVATGIAISSASCLQLVGRFREQHAVAGEDRRRLRRLQQVRGVGDAVVGRRRRGRSRAGGATSPAPARRCAARRRPSARRSAPRPGGPVCARFSARGITSGRNFASSTRQTRLQIGR